MSYCLHFTLFFFPLSDCPALTEPINGSLSSDLVTVGSSVTVSCISGHTLFGDETLECLTNGSWTAPVGTCRKGILHL